MILERKPGVNIPELKEQYGPLASKIEIADFESLIEFAKLMQIYNGAMKEVSAKLEVLDEEFQINYKHNPIHHIECRLKGPRSIYDKMNKYGIDLSLEAAQEHIFDIAGIRVICSYHKDIYTVERLLLNQTDVKLISRKDYIAQPKENGYRSLHIVVKVPVFLSEQVKETPAEIQLRTIAMDYWASLEHELRYKNAGNMQKYSGILLDCANTLAETEKKMECIHEIM